MQSWEWPQGAAREKTVGSPTPSQSSSWRPAGTGRAVDSPPRPSGPTRDSAGRLPDSGHTANGRSSPLQASSAATGTSRRDVDFDRELETLDQKEVELHQSQLRILREQTALFLRDLALLQGEVVSVKEGIEQLRGRHSESSQDHRDKLNSFHASVSERLTYLEQSLGESAGKHAQEIELLKTSHSRAAAETRERDSHHESIAERLSHVEAQLADSADRHSQELKELLHNEMEARQRHRASLDDRVAKLERMTSEAHDSHAQELRAAKSKLEHVHRRISDFEGHGSALEELWRMQGSAKEEHKAALSQHQASTNERLQFLETRLGESADRHAKEVQALKAAHSHRDAHHTSVAERLGYLEKMLGDSAEKHVKELEALKAAHSRQDTHHASFGERLSYMEKMLGDSAEKHTKEVEALKAGHSQRDAHHASMAERMSFVERRLGDSAERHAKEIEALKSAHSQRDTHHASVAERLSFVERALGDSADKHSQELKAAHARLDTMHTRVLECESHGLHIEGLQKSRATEQEARGEHHASVKKRLDQLESSMKDMVASEKASRDQQHNHLLDLIGREKDARGIHQDAHQELLARDRAAHEKRTQDLHAALHKESSERSQHHTTILERVEALQWSTNKAEGLLAKEVEDRKTECRRIWDAIDNHTHDLNPQVVTEATALRSPPPQASVQVRSASPVVRVQPLPSTKPAGLLPEEQKRATNCPTCGNVYMADSVFCRHCGQKRTEARELQDSPSLRRAEELLIREGFHVGSAPISPRLAGAMRPLAVGSQALHY
eukprot:TRINITY_DN21661_c0_g1_i2.p1 TRINITY_DN21661_c0_g1~~TRINITY_DN21661_c0_g1_i2.p1  ORF type:complete len:787 (+),score=183.82 TRINITY_DN21661_c0_g1_i2:25-2385(+)